MAGEQAVMVRRLTTSGAGLDVVVGKAGAGKTFALDAAREAWQESGIRVIGCALAARAAGELQAGAGIDSYTIDALLIELDHTSPGGGLASGSVVIVDEAGMVGTRKLARLINHAERAQSKVVLVGDHHQLPEIDAGGVFRGFVNRLPVIELSENRRQRHRWEAHALDQLRSGDPAAAVTEYQIAGRIVVGDTAEAVQERLVSDWYEARSSEPGQDEEGVMVAARVADVENLNQRARARLIAAGELTGPALVSADGREFQVGDRIVCLRNDRRLGVVNGTRARVTLVDPEADSLTVSPDGGRHAVVLSRRYLDGGHVAHGYAMTAHKVQGLTVERTWTFGTDAIYREWGYVAMSRGRESNHMYVVAGADDGGEQLHVQTSADGADVVCQLTEGLGRSRAQSLATDYVAGIRKTGAPFIKMSEEHADAYVPLDVAISSSVAARRERLRDRRAAAVEHAKRVRQSLQAAQRQGGDYGPLRRLLHRDRTRQLDGKVARLTGDLNAWEHRIEEVDAELLLLERGGGDAPGAMPPKTAIRDAHDRSSELVRAAHAAAMNRSDQARQSQGAAMELH